MIKLFDHIKVTGITVNDENTFRKVIETLNLNHLKIVEIFLPYPVDLPVDNRLTKKISFGRIAFIGGLFGLVLSILLLLYFQLNYPMQFGNKPFFPVIAMVPVVFVLTLLFAGAGVAIAFFIKEQLIPGQQPKIYPPHGKPGQFCVLVHRQEEIQNLFSSTEMIEFFEDEYVVQKIALPFPVKVSKVILFLFIVLLQTGCQRTKISGYDKSLIFQTDTLDESKIGRHVAVDEFPYPFPKTNEGYENAGRELKNPLPLTSENLDRGKTLYVEYCKQCHGLNGKSDAPMINANKFPPPPNYSKRIKTISAGKMFHSLTFGKNLMPSFQKDLSPDERWELIIYVRKLAGVTDTIK